MDDQRYYVNGIRGYPMDAPRARNRQVEYSILDRVHCHHEVQTFTGQNSRHRATQRCRVLNMRETRWERQSA